MSQQVGDVYGIGSFAPSGKAGESAKAYVYILVVVVVIVLVFYIINQFFGGIHGLLQKLGIEDTEEEKAAKKKIADATAAASSPASPWSPAVYRAAPSGTKIFTAADVQALAKQIWDSVGVIYDDPEQGLAAIKQCDSKVKVSQLADSFNTKYSRDLYDWLRLKYDNTNQRLVFGEIIDYVNNLKMY